MTAIGFVWLRRFPIEYEMTPVMIAVLLATQWAAFHLRGG